MRRILIEYKGEVIGWDSSYFAHDTSGTLQNVSELDLGLKQSIDREKSITEL